jgi:hypothetical protein
MVKLVVRPADVCERNRVVHVSKLEEMMANEEEI